MTTRRRRFLILSLAIAALVIGPYLASRARSAGRQVRVFSREAEVSAEPVSSIRVLIYNIAHGRGAIDENWKGTAAEKRARIDEIAQLIAEADADVVILNEVDFCSTWSGHQDQAEAIARAAGFPHWVEQRNLDFRLLYGSWKFGNAVLSRHPIVDAELLELPALRQWEKLLAGCKQAVVCTLQLSPTQQVRVVAVHLEHRSEDVRASSARVILDAAASSTIPLIAAGDFNSTLGGSPHSERTAAGENAMEILRDSRQFEMPAPPPAMESEMTYSSTAPTRVIDWVLIPAGWEYAEYRVIRSELSDHRPVTADVRLPAPAGNEWHPSAGHLHRQVSLP